MKTNINHLKRIEKIEKAVKPVIAEGSIQCSEFCDVPDLPTAIAKARSVKSHFVTFVPLIGPVLDSAFDKPDALQPRITFCFEGPQRTHDQLSRLVAFSEAEVNKDSNLIEHIAHDWNGELEEGKQVAGGEFLLTHDGQTTFHVLVEPSELPQPKCL